MILIHKRNTGFKSGEGSWRPLSTTISVLNAFPPRTTVQVSFFPRARSLLLSDPLGHTCYLELARGLTYTLHVSPPRDGDPRAVPVDLKGPPMSF
jgi:hypothetical protein